MQYCPECGEKNDDDAGFCQSCGSRMEHIHASPVQNRVPGYQRRPAQFEPQRFYTPPRNDDSAITSLILGIASFIFCPVVCAIPAIMVGNASKQRIAMSGGTLTGESLATIGIVLGWVNIAISCVVGLIILVAIASSSAPACVMMKLAMCI